MHRLFCLALPFLLCSCAGNNFDEATIPTDQLSAELAFRRVADHGGMEAVLEENQEFTGWQFHISSKSTTSILGGEPVLNFYLKDRAGIEYTVSSSSTAKEVTATMDMGYGYADGRVLSVERDLAAGEIRAEVRLDSWRERK